MKQCPKCNCQYTEEHMYCEKCGQKLIRQQTSPSQNEHPSFAAPSEVKKKRFTGVVVVVALLLIGLAVLYLFREQIFSDGKISYHMGAAETDKEQAQGDEKQQNEAEHSLQTETEDVKGVDIDHDQKDESSDSSDTLADEKAEPKDTSENPDQEDDYADAQVNGVDQAYVQVSGRIVNKNGRIVLEMPEKVTVCALNPENQVVQKERVQDLILEGDGMEEYIGDQMSIKGKLSADISENFYLQAVRAEVEKEAVKEETTEFKQHHYQLIKDDVTWEEAFEDCMERGGYLAQINSEEEFQSVTALIEEEGLEDVHFFLGGRRKSDEPEYYWMDPEERFVGEALNPEGESWAADHWMEEEPSFSSDGEEEMYLNLVHFRGAWVFNDVPADISMYYTGRIGYICEVDES